VAREVYPTAAAVIVALIFGLSFLFTKGVLFYLAPFQLLGLRFAIAALSLTLLVSFKVVRLHINRSGMPDLLKIAVWQPGLYFICETYGVKLTSASESGVIIALVPVVTAVLSFFILKERISFKQGVFITAAVIGVMLMAVGRSGVGFEFSEHMVGVLFLLGAVLAASFYNIFSCRASVNHSPLDITFVMMWLGALVFNFIGLTYSFFTGDLESYVLAVQRLPVVVGLLYLGLLSSVIAFFLLNYALSCLTASRVAVFLNLVPVVALLAGMVFYEERLNSLQTAGCVMILLGIWGTNYFAEKRKDAREVVAAANEIK